MNLAVPAFATPGAVRGALPGIALAAAGALAAG
jgi:hypothetical protein